METSPALGEEWPEWDNGNDSLHSESNLVFVSWDTGIIDRCDSDVVIVDLEAVGYVPDGDDHLDSGRVEELARDHGVPVADLWAAYKREREQENVSLGEDGSKMSRVAADVFSVFGVSLSDLLSAWQRERESVS
jgi:hypothetical protein